MRRRRPAPLASQMQRAALSIPASIAEGCGHEGPKELKRFLAIARASASELQAHLLVARDLELLTNTSLDTLLANVTSVQRMLTSLQQRVAASTASGHPP
jgi:four helix bundle protein